MDFTKKLPQPVMETDMTPMIDCVFQLIIFFMLITDMTQLELTDIELPEARVAVEDKPDPKDVRPILNIASDGRILVKNEVVYDPARDDQFLGLRQYLARTVALMPTEPMDANRPGSRRIPANPVLIRADQSTPSSLILRVMEVCASSGVEIRKVELAVKPADAPAEPGRPGVQDR